MSKYGYMKYVESNMGSTETLLKNLATAQIREALRPRFRITLIALNIYYEQKFTRISTQRDFRLILNYRSTFPPKAVQRAIYHYDIDFDLILVIINTENGYAMHCVAILCVCLLCSVLACLFF